MDPPSTLLGDCDHAEVYLDSGELEPDGSWSFHGVSEGFQWPLPRLLSCLTLTLFRRYQKTVRLLLTEKAMSRTDKCKFVKNTIAWNRTVFNVHFI